MKNPKRIFLSVLFLTLSAAAAGCGKAPSQISAQESVYQCSMHPAIKSSKPENCPICGMRLTRVEHAGQASAPSGKRKILFYRHPMNPKISSPVPAKDEMGMDYIPVYEDEQAGGARPVDGRAVVTIDPVKQQLIGVRIGEAKKQNLEMNVRALGRVAYDPDLHNTIGEYREAVGEYIKSKASPYMEIRQRAETVMKLADLKLRLSGISSQQMDEMKNIGQSNFRLLAFRHSAQDLSLPQDAKWVYVDLYEDEADLPEIGQKITATSAAIPGQIFEGIVRASDLIPNASIRTVRVRAEVPDPHFYLREGQPLDVVLHVSLGEKIAVPQEAILNTGEKNLVFVQKGEGKFEPREVQVGHEAGDYQEVLSGLAEGEKVVVSANFLIDSESRIRAALQNFGGGQSHD